MVNRMFNPLIARFAAVAALLALVLAAPAAFAQDTSIDYAENGTEPVATFAATDQDGDPVEWSLSGADAKLFTIEGGVLAFKKSPDYEKPGTAVGGTIADRNVYNVTIGATGGTHDVTVTVTNVDEAGKVTINKPQPQVGRGLEASLSDNDGSVSDEVWQWARSEDGETWADIEGATSQSRSPTSDDAGHYLRATVTYTDLFGSGKSVSAVTTNKVETRTVANAAPSFADQDENANTRTVIEVTRSVAENSGKGIPVGKPVSATDADSDVLLYTLEDGNMVLDTSTTDDADDTIHHDNNTPADTTNDGTDGDSRYFTIDSASGQIKVKNDDELDHEVPKDVTDTDITETEGQTGSRNTYVVTVIATDPSGAATLQRVVISVEDVNESPAFSKDAPTTLWVTENELADNGDAAAPIRTKKTFTEAAPNALGEGAFVAPDNDNADNSDNADDPVDAVRYSLVESDDSERFSLDAETAVLTVVDPAKLDYEKQSSYSLTIVATSQPLSAATPPIATEPARLRSARLNVTVNVVDNEDAGSIELSQLESQVGQTVIATLSDKDGGITVTKWEWARVALTGDPLDCPAATAVTAQSFTEGAIDNASSAAYTPVADDINMCLVARVTYTDNIAGDGEGDTPVNQDGVADNDNMDGVYVSQVTDAAVQASDPANAAPKFPDQDPNAAGDQSDETSRSIAENTKAGQSIGAPVTAGDTDQELVLYTLGGADADSFSISRVNGQLTTKGKLDYETKGAYMVVVTATDPSGAADSILVTINVTDEDDSAKIALITGNSPVFAEEETTRSVAENTAMGMNIGDPVMATDEDGDTLTYTLGGADADSFDIDGATGQLMTKAALDYETKMSYTVTVTASDGETDDAAITVTISVTDTGLDNAYDLNEDGTIQRDEVIAAIQDYLADTIDRSEVVALIHLYYANGG